MIVRSLPLLAALPLRLVGPSPQASDGSDPGFYYLSSGTASGRYPVSTVN